MYKGDNTLNHIGNPKEGQVVVCAANRHEVTGLIVTGARHLDSVMRTQIFALTGNGHEVSVDWINNVDTLITSDRGWYPPDCQGFIDNFGDWLNREEAWYVADKAGQIIRQNEFGRVGYLFSENLY
jgi:hypothetical protein